MTFIEALDAAFKDSDRITRSVWNNRNIYCAVEEGKLCIKGAFNTTTGQPDSDGLFHPWTVTEQDYFAHDWEILSDA